MSAELEAASIIQGAGGGMVGAVALLLVGLGLGVAMYLWRAYQKQLADTKAEDKEEKTQLRKEVDELREEGRVREERLMGLVAQGQQLQQDTNKILFDIKSELAYLRGAVGAKTP